MATPEQRAAWQAAETALAAINDERAALLRPTEQRHAAAQLRLAKIEDEIGEPFCTCEGCGEPVFAGEPWLRGETPLCGTCAPTYAELLGSAADSFVGPDGEPMSAAQRRALYDAHIAAGGLPTDSMAEVA